MAEEEKKSIEAWEKELMDFVEAGEWERLGERAQTCIHQYEDKAVGYAFYGMTLINVESFTEAIANFDKAIEIDAEYSYAYRNRGAAKFKLERYEEAIDDYDKAINIDDESYEFFYNRGTTKFKLDRHEEAIADFEQAIKFNPSYNAAHGSWVIAKASLRAQETTEELIRDYK